MGCLSSVFNNGFGNLCSSMQQALWTKVAFLSSSVKAIFGTFRVLAQSKTKCLLLTNSLSKIVLEIKKK